MSLARCWNTVLVVRPHPGHAVTWGRNERSPSAWSEVEADTHPEGPVSPGLWREARPDGVADALVQKNSECTLRWRRFPFAPMPASVSPRCSG